MMLSSWLRASTGLQPRHMNPYRLALVTFLVPGLVLADDDATSSRNQFSAPFTDQATGLKMERFFGARTSFGFAFALPETPPATGTAGSFIGQFTFPLTRGQGWGALGLTGDMEGNFILAVWPDGRGSVMASFRQATDEDNPPEVTGEFSVTPIPGPDGTGVSVNQTSLTYTFLCASCLNSTLGLGPEAVVAGSAVMGWALSERAPEGDPADPGVRLGFHERGFGPFTARLREARAAGFEGVAATVARITPVSASRRARIAVPGAFQGGGGGGDGDGDSGDDDSGDEDDD
ncbi:Cytochrome domain of cellobiose dehydrogenase [Microdochium nivale]|nr:Cytochrome domain of cellobiose dehydrogenase [Microdochium nivale]